MTETLQENGGPHSVFELVNRGLDDLRRRVDEMMVRFDVGEMNVRGEVHSDLDRAVNMALLAKSRLLHMGHHMGSRLGVLPEHHHEHAHHAEATSTNGKSPARHARPEKAKSARSENAKG